MYVCMYVEVLTRPTEIAYGLRGRIRPIPWMRCVCICICVVSFLFEVR